MFHCLVSPLCVYLHLNQSNLWRTALPVSGLLLGKDQLRINECLNVLSRKISDFVFFFFHVHLEIQVGFGAGDNGRTVPVVNSTGTTYSGCRNKSEEYVVLQAR